MTAKTKAATAHDELRELDENVRRAEQRFADTQQLAAEHFGAKPRPAWVCPACRRESRMRPGDPMPE